MLDAHFTDDELAFLRQAKSRSDALSALESRAMHAVQGRFLDERGQFTRTGPPDLELARRLMNGPEYHRAKAEIMTPIQDFLGRVESRTAAEVMRLRRRGERLHLVAIVGLGTAVVLVLVSFALLARPRMMALFRLARPVSGVASMARGQGERPVGPVDGVAAPRRGRRGLCVGAHALLVAEREHRGAGPRRCQERAGDGAPDHRAVRRRLADRDHPRGRRLGPIPAVRDADRAGDGPEGGELLTPLSSLPGFVGYLICDPAGRIVTSDDRALLTRTVTRELGEDLSVAMGRSPDHAIVVFPDGRRTEPGDEVTFPRDIVVAAAVRDDRDRAAGVLLLRFDPRLDLSRILDRGRLGESGQSYAFDRAGRQLVESRFGRPGGPEPAPSTRMARAALAGRSGLDVDGYRDYRGVPVIGAWTWNEHYGIGIATEVALNEAYGALAGYQRQTRLGTGLAVLLIVGPERPVRVEPARHGGGVRQARERVRDHPRPQRAHGGRAPRRPRPSAQHGAPHLPRLPRARRRLRARDASARPRARRRFLRLLLRGRRPSLLLRGGRVGQGRRGGPLHGRGQDVDQGAGRRGSVAGEPRDLRQRRARPRQRRVHVRHAVRGPAGHHERRPRVHQRGPRPAVRAGLDGSLERLDERHGPMAGAAPGIVYRESRRRLAPGDVLVAFTDGVTEARDNGARLFSEERAAEAVRAGRVRSAADAVDRLVSAVEAFAGHAEQADDITILALQFRPSGHGPSRDRVSVETVVIRNRPSDLDAIEALLDRLVERARLPADTMAEIRVVCDEVLANVIAHGFPDDGEHEIEVSVGMAGRRLVLRVSDDGSPVRSAGRPAAGYEPAARRTGRSGGSASTWFATSSTS